MLEQHTAKIATAVLAVTASTHFTRQQQQNNREKHAVFGMFSCSNSPFVSSDDSSESNFSFPQDRSDDNRRHSVRRKFCEILADIFEMLLHPCTIQRHEGMPFQQTRKRKKAGEQLF